jgi:protein-disulfide isomerase
LAAKTGWCVYKAKGSETFFKFKSSAFEAQAELSPAKISSIAEGLGMDRAALDACVNDFNTQRVISDQVAEGKAAGIEGTPAIYINSKALEAGFIPKIFKAVMDKL